MSTSAFTQLLSSVSFTPSQPLRLYQGDARADMVDYEVDWALKTRSSELSKNLRLGNDRYY